MRLNKQQTEAATQELVALVQQYPGAATSALRGTPKFHGMRTLSLAQIIRLLRKAGAQPTLEGAGIRTYYSWTVRS